MEWTRSESGGRERGDSNGSRASDLLDGLKETFRERAGMVRNGRRGLATASTLVNKVFMAMLETVPIEQLVTMQRNIASASYAVGVRRPGTTTTKNMACGCRGRRSTGCWKAARVTVA